MSNLETPFLPPGRAPGTAGAATAKDPKSRLTPGGRDERGQAFRNLLQNLDKGAGKTASAAHGKGADASQVEATQTAEANAAGLMLDAMAPVSQPEPPAGATDAARLLLGALQAPAREAQTDARKEPGTRRDAFAALNSALAKTATAASDTATAARTSAAGETGPAMPGDIATPIELPGLTGLAEATESTPGKAEIAARDASPETPLTITVVRQETHLPPVMRLSPLQQVAEPIRQATAELSLARSDAVPDLGSAKPAAIAEPTKILHIQLSPVELGSIVVKLRISQGGMEIRLEASRAETAQMLANDREALRAIVKASGYALDQVSVETVHVDTATPDPRPGGQDNARDNTKDGGSDGRWGAREGRGFDQSREREQREPQGRDGRQDATTSKEEPHEPRDIGRPGRDPDRYL